MMIEVQKRRKICFFSNRDLYIEKKSIAAKRKKKKEREKENKTYS